ncbi:MAG TPA: hypothetical protein VN901_03355 [Candidatus Acidoferrales bacterium]|nr:hypothetical protein [Candidatus Acidoferrales bacterium]
MVTATSFGGRITDHSTDPTHMNARLWDFEVDPRKVNVCLVAATHRDLEKLIVQNANFAAIWRRADIPLLVRYFAQKLAWKMRKSIEAIPAAATKALAT